MIINLEKYLPLNDTNSIQVLLNDIEQRMQLYNDQEIGQVLMHIKKVKLQLFFRNGIDEINKKTRKTKRKLALEQRDNALNTDEGSIVYTTGKYDTPFKPTKPVSPAKAKKSTKATKATNPDKPKAKKAKSIPKSKLSPFFREDRGKGKRKMIRERNAKAAAHISASTLNERGKSIVPIYIPMGGKRR